LAWVLRAWLDMTLLFIGSVRSGKIEIRGLSACGVFRILGILGFFGSLGLGCNHLLSSWTALGLGVLGVGFFLSLWFYGLDRVDRERFKNGARLVIASKRSEVPG